MPSGQLNGLSSHRRNLSSKNLNKAQLTRSATTLALSAARVPGHPKVPSLGKKRNSTTEIELSGGVSGSHPVDAPNGLEDEDFDMTFLQYCPICDKQILVPNSQILYCSEGCRQKDSLSTTPPPELKLSTRRSSILLSSSLSPISIMSSPTKRFMDIPNQEEQSRLAKYITSSSPTENETKPAKLHDHKPDLDPTEWKPNSTPSTGSNTTVSAAGNPLMNPDLHHRLHHNTKVMDEQEKEPVVAGTTVQNPNLRRPTAGPRRDSAAFTYLSKFHRSASSFISLTNSERGKRASSRSASPAAILPSLAHSSRNSSNASLSAISSISTAGSGLCLGCHISLAASTSSHEESASGFGRTSIDENVKGVGEMRIESNADGAGAEGRLRGLLAKV